MQRSGEATSGQPVFLLIGPPAVGKSSASRALAARFGRSLHIPVDDLRDMVVSGLALPSLDWNQDLVQQIALARESAIRMALSYRRAGFAVVIDDFLDPNQLREYRALPGDPGIHRFVLAPDQDTAHARNLRRAGGGPGREYIDEGIRAVYRQLRAASEQLREDGWIVLDTTELSIDETVLAILKRSETHAPG